MIRLYFILFIQCLFTAGVYSQAAFSINGSECESTTFKFRDTSPVAVDTWLWNFGDGNISNEQHPSHAYADTGNYIVTLRIESGLLIDSINQPLPIYKNPVANFSINTVNYSSFSRKLIDSSFTSSPISQYIWDFGDNTDSLIADTNVVLYKYQEAGDYSIRYTVIDENGCTDSISKPINIQDVFRVPNVFTPNGDLANDNFIVTTNGIDLFEIYIYSRWGSLVFKREGHQQIDWDGRMPNGNIVKTGVYYYVINVLDSDKQYSPETGFIHVFND